MLPLYIRCGWWYGPRMVKDHDRPSAGVRPSWLNAVVRELQMAVGRMSTRDPNDVHAMLNSLARRLPAPANHVERTMLHGLLLEAACRAAILPVDGCTNRHVSPSVRQPIRT